MPELPSGVVTFVFTDIEGSTRLFRRLGGAYPSLLERHNELLRAAWELHGGYEVKTEGDSFFVAFADAGAAVAACAEAQRCLQSEPWPMDGLVRVRMGVHAGLAYPRDGDYVAFAVHQAARVVSAANGGQIVVSAQAAALAGTVSGVTLLPVGRFRLRDFDEPVELFSVAAGGMARSSVALRALPADGHNLVRPRTRLIGREGEISGVASLAGSGRLVSIVGPGGVGKTRLVIELGLRFADEWPDGVWFVDLSVIVDPSAICVAVAEAVGCPAAGDAALSTLLEHLGSRVALLLFDNCEHLLDDVASIVDAILMRSPGVGIITTSRTSLGRVDEMVWRLGPLATDGDMVGPAVELFRERARAVRGAVAGADDDPAVASICRRLDGLPLAIELAAARVAVLTPAEINAGLEDRFRLLRGRDRTVPERQRTLEALLDWSYQLLSDAERTALNRLGIFAASFDTETATAALATDDLDAYDVPELVWSLCDKSLIVVEPAANATRYRLLDSIRHYARRHLDDLGDTVATARRLAAWYLDRLGPGLVLVTQFENSRTSELENLKSLVDNLERADPSTAQLLVIAADRLHRFASSYLVATAYLRDGLRRLPEATPVRVELLCRLSYVLGCRGECDAAQDVLDEAVEVERVAGRPPWDPTMLQAALADLLYVTGDHQGALATAVRALDERPSDLGRVVLQSRAAVAATALGDLAAAATWFHLVHEGNLRSGDTASLANDHSNLAEIAYRQGDLVSAAEHQLSALRVGGQFDDRIAIAFSMILAGRLAHRRGDLTTFVQINAAGEAGLDAMGTVLYDDDRHVTDELLADATALLGPAEVAVARAAGAALDLPDAIALTEELLTAAATVAVASKRPSRTITTGRGLPT